MGRFGDLIKRIEALERPLRGDVELYWPGDGREPHPADAIALTWDEDGTPLPLAVAPPRGDAPGEPSQ